MAWGGGISRLCASSPSARGAAGDRLVDRQSPPKKQIPDGEGQALGSPTPAVSTHNSHLTIHRQCFLSVAVVKHFICIIIILIFTLYQSIVDYHCRVSFRGTAK